MRFRDLMALAAIGVVYFGTAVANAENVDTARLESSSTSSMQVSDDFENASEASAEHSRIGATVGGAKSDTWSTVKNAPPISAPEIDSQSAVSALMLLLGALAVLHGRRIARRTIA
jgi:hypothetical protein